MEIRHRLVDDDGLLVGLFTDLGYPVSLGQLTVRLNNLLANPDYQLWIVADKGVILGMLGFCKMQAFEFDEPYIRILILVTNVKYRRQGIANRLLKKLEKWCLAEGYQKMALNTGISKERQGAHQFYRQFGFEEKSKGLVLKVEAKP